MYPVSNEFMTAIQDNTRNYFYEGLIETKGGKKYSFSNKDIVKGSGSIINQCCGDSEIEIGSVYAAELDITLYSDIDRYTLEDAIISLSFFLDVGAAKYEEVPMGIFKVSEATRNINCLSIKAYDYMLRFDKEFSNILSSGTPFDFLTLACKTCKVVLAHTQEEIEAMPNGNYLLGIYADNDIETWRDVLYYVAQVLGCFCTINRAGQLELRKYNRKSLMLIASEHRFTSSFSDFVTRYTAVSSTNVSKNTSEYYNLDPDDGLTMNLGTNPLLQFGLQETRETLLRNILNDVAVINYVPFDSTTIGNPAFDLGDVITFSGGHADENQITCITKYEYKINGRHSLQCVGKNPRLANAKSKNDKNIIGLMNSIEAGKIIIHTFMNASPFTVSESNVEVASIEFASNENTDAQFHGCILLNVTADEVTKTGTIGEDEFSFSDDGQAEVEVTYVLNDTEINTFYPKETWHSGMHILNLYYPLTGLDSNAYNTFKIRLKMTGGTAYIDRGQAICTISGQGLSSNNVWDGRLEVKEDYEPISLLPSISICKMEDNTVVKQQIPRPILPIDSFGKVSFGTFDVLNFKDTIQINPVIVTEIIEVADRDEMSFNRTLIKTESVFEMQYDYSFSSKEEQIDEGRLTKVAVNTEQFADIISLEVSQDEQL